MPQESTPFISVLMSVYNGQRYLQEAVESILNQTFSDFEFIILDDASTDNTRHILNAYAQQDPRIVLVRNEENIGLTRSLNKGLGLAKGKYIARQDADDVALPERLMKQVNFLEEHPETILVSCNIDVINDKGYSVGKFLRACEPNLVAWYLLFYNHLAGHSQVMYKCKQVLDLGGYSETYRYSQDYELWLRLSTRGDIAILPNILQQWRRHEKSISSEVFSEQDSYQLTASKLQISKLIGVELCMAQMVELKGFWGGRFPDSKRVGALHIRMKQIYEAFLQQRKTQISFDPDLPHKLRIIIGKQFLYWVQNLSMKEALFSKLKVSIYALSWHSLGVLNFWINYPWSVLRRKLSS